MNIVPGCSISTAAKLLSAGFPLPHPSCFVCCDKFVLVLAGDLLGIIEKNHCFRWLTFFLLDLLLEVCTDVIQKKLVVLHEMISEGTWDLVFLEKLFLFFFCLRLSLLNLLPFKLHSYYHPVSMDLFPVMVKDYARKEILQHIGK